MLAYSLVTRSFLILVLCVTYICTTPIHNHLEEGSPLCPSSWFLYRKFCVTRAPPGTEKVVALYCDGMGGIGVSGLCVIKARSGIPGVIEEDADLESPTPDDLSPLQLTNADQSLPTSQDGLDMVDASSDVMDDDTGDVSGEEEGVCPAGWSHYQALCVRRLWRSQDCHQMGAVYLHGLCLKHAETREENQMRTARGLALGKRICCCAHVKARANNYGC